MDGVERELIVWNEKNVAASVVRFDCSKGCLLVFWHPVQRLPAWKSGGKHNEPANKQVWNNFRGYLGSSNAVGGKINVEESTSKLQ